MGSIIWLLLVVFGIWAAAGAILMWVGKAGSISDGMKSVAVTFLNWWNEGEWSFPISEQEVVPLTQELNRLFQYVIYIEGNRNKDCIVLEYRFMRMQIDTTLVDAVFQKYLRNYRSFAPGTQIFTDCYEENAVLVLVCAFSPEGRSMLRDQRLERLSKQMPHNDDIVE